MQVNIDCPCILVVDDDRLVMATLVVGLGQMGFNVMYAASGEEAVRVCQQCCPDLILMDIRMPGISGIEAARQIRAINEIPVLFLSAFDDTDIVQQAITEGGMGYLVKPVDIRQLAPTIQAALARVQDMRRLKETEAQLNQALSGERYASIAVGILMAQLRLNERDAFELLRAKARDSRRKLNEVAKEIMNSIELCNTTAKNPGQNIEISQD